MIRKVCFTLGFDIIMFSQCNWFLYLFIHLLWDWAYLATFCIGIYVTESIFSPCMLSSKSSFGVNMPSIMNQNRRMILNVRRGQRPLENLEKYAWYKRLLQDWGDNFVLPTTIYREEKKLHPNSTPLYNLLKCIGFIY